MYSLSDNRLNGVNLAFDNPQWIKRESWPLTNSEHDLAGINTTSDTEYKVKGFGLTLTLPDDVGSWLVGVISGIRFYW